jgi:pimeloyl-ACP methyl ester carboxylesterase
LPVRDASVQAAEEVQMEKSAVLKNLSAFLLSSFLLAACASGSASQVSPPRDARAAIGDLDFAAADDGARIAYYDSGPDDGRVVVLLASLGRSVSDFNELAAELNAAGYRTLAVEMRGVARSSPVPAARASLYDLGDDIEAALAAAGIAAGRKIDLIGHAFGNRLARAYASRRSERVGRLVLIAAGGAQDLEKAPEALAALKRSFDWSLPASERKAAIEYAFFAEGATAPDHWLAGWYPEAAQFQSSAVRATPEAEWRAAGGKARILIVQAAEDRIAPPGATSAPLQKEFPARVTVETIDGAGHALLPEQPAAIERAVIAFLRAN